MLVELGSIFPDNVNLWAEEVSRRQVHFTRQLITASVLSGDDNDPMLKLVRRALFSNWQDARELAKLDSN